jgi:hypothetical protein
MKTQKQEIWFAIPEAWMPGYDDYMEQTRRAGQAAYKAAQLGLQIESRKSRAKERRQTHKENSEGCDLDAENAAKYPDEPVYLGAENALIVQFIIMFAVGAIVLFGLWCSL